MNEIIIITGSMFSGKTSRLIEFLKENKNKKSIVLKPEFDHRYNSIDKIQTHDGKEYPAQSINKDLSILPVFIDISKYDIIAIDEAQFFLNLEDFIYYSLNAHKNKIFVVSGLDSDFQLHDFGEINKILKYATQIIKLHSKCECGKPAYFNYRVSEELDQVVVGGKDKYEPKCWDCFHKPKEAKYL